MHNALKQVCEGSFLRRVGLLVVVCLLLAGCSPSTTSSTNGGNAGARPTRSFAGLVDLGSGRKMYLECRGSGSPTVVLVSGLDAAADVWTGYQAHPALAVFAGVAGFARVCAYDRPGTPVGDDLTPSRSTPVPQPTTAHDAVRDLHALLQAAGEPGPYILVGHSYGGLITRRYAGEYPGGSANHQMPLKKTRHHSPRTTCAVWRDVRHDFCQRHRWQSRLVQAYPRYCSSPR
jgi:pimeloyl-ACP methyl ester carboxylesterase